MGAGSTFSQGANTNIANPYAGTDSPYFQAANAQALGNLAGAQAATAANRVNQSTPYANLNYVQTGTDANGNPIWSANQTLNPMFQGTLSNLAQNAQQSSQTSLSGLAPQLQTGVSGTGMEGWDRATALINQRLQPQIQQSEERLQAQLANQGIAPGTEAYNRAMTQQSQQTNDLLTQAQLTGSQVQNQMFGQNLQAGQFGNAAQQQMFANQVTAQNNPYSQLGAFNQATSGNYINPYQQAATGSPDYMGALGTQTNAQIAAQNAALGQATNQTAGLYGLGSAGILGLAANPGLVTSAVNGIGNAYNWLTS